MVFKDTKNSKNVACCIFLGQALKIKAEKSHESTNKFSIAVNEPYLTMTEVRSFKAGFIQARLCKIQGLFKDF